MHKWTSFWVKTKLDKTCDKDCQNRAKTSRYKLCAGKNGRCFKNQLPDKNRCLKVLVTVPRWKKSSHLISCSFPDGCPFYGMIIAALFEQVQSNFGITSFHIFQQFRFTIWLCSRWAGIKTKMRRAKLDPNFSRFFNRDPMAEVTSCLAHYDNIQNVYKEK